MYKFWTVQDKKVLDAVNNNGYYKADISKSIFVNKNPELKELYTIIVNSFNKINGLSLNGVIFAFAFSDDTNIYCFNNYDAFSSYIKLKKDVIRGLWNTFCNDRYVVLELEYKKDFNPIFIDINDFQLLIPPLMVLPPYTKASFDRILNNISVGEITLNEFPSYLIQVHLPTIEKENIINVYPTFPLD